MQITNIDAMDGHVGAEVDVASLTPPQPRTSDIDVDLRRSARCRSLSTFSATA